MDWGNIGTQIILGITGIVISALGAFVTYLINKYVKDEKLKNMLLGFDSLVKDCVAETQQIYVSTLKQEGNFGEEAQKKALMMSLEKVKSKITVEMWDYIVTNYKDPDGYILSKIESALGLLKFKN